jgi:hypothetical protein
MVERQLAAIRQLFDWLVTGQLVPMNPAAFARGPRHVFKGNPPLLMPGIADAPKEPLIRTIGPRPTLTTRRMNRSDVLRRTKRRVQNALHVFCSRLKTERVRMLPGGAVGPSKEVVGLLVVGDLLPGGVPRK